MRIIPLNPLTIDRRDVLVLFLAWAAGSVDAIGYFGLDHVFTANMTGNMVLLGLALGQGYRIDVLRNLVAVAGFIVGLVIGALVGIGGGTSCEWDDRVTRIVWIETAAMGGFTIAWHLFARPYGPRALDLLILLSALAMGLQSAGVRRMNLPGVTTTYVTGTMNALVTGLTTRFYHTLRATNLSAAIRESVHWKHPTRLQFNVLLMYGGSAVVSGFLQTQRPALVAIVPLVALVIVLFAVALSKGQPPAPANTGS